MTREQFDGLSDTETVEYVARILAALHNASSSPERLELRAHYEDVVNWVLPRDDFFTLVAEQDWETSWPSENDLAETQKESSQGPDLGEEPKPAT